MPHPTTILFLAANPKGTNPLRLDEEMREIENGLQRAKHRDRYSLRQLGRSIVWAQSIILQQAAIGSNFHASKPL